MGGGDGNGDSLGRRNRSETQPSGVREARKEEMKFFRKMDTYTRCPRAEVDKEHGKLIDVRWITPTKGTRTTPTTVHG